jgi:hypothetical protein
MSGSSGGVAFAGGAGQRYTPPFYSTIEEVIILAGIKPVDFDFEDDLGLVENGRTAEEKLTALVTSWLVSVKNFIDHHRNRDYTQEVLDGSITEVPYGIHNIALRAASNMASLALLRRETSVQRVDIMTRLKGDEVFTEALLRDLALFPAKPRFRMSVSVPTAVTVSDSLNQPGSGYYD